MDRIIKNAKSSGEPISQSTADSTLQNPVSSAPQSEREHARDINSFTEQLSSELWNERENLQEMETSGNLRSDTLHLFDDITNRDKNIQYFTSQGTIRDTRPSSGDELHLSRSFGELHVDSTILPETMASYSTLIGNEQLYEAYNLLHSLAQDFHKPFDAPAVLVIGQQTDGKSALIEALMGFQFNYVGGGIKTRRPITLHMQYNGRCSQPSYIEMENKRLECNPLHHFDSREIILRIEYKYCPNLTIIDTPGLFSVLPCAKKPTPEQQAFAQAAKEVEELVLSKMQRQEYIILCVEDVVDWSHATTRRLVLNVDPDLQRTVLVNTKLDTKLPQFADSNDLEGFLTAKPITDLHPNLLGGPFFTAVPSGRVGHSTNCMFSDNEEFREALLKQELSDRSYIELKLGHALDDTIIHHLGVSELRKFLEELLRARYMQSVPAIVPLLQAEFRRVDNNLQQTTDDLNNLSMEYYQEHLLYQLQQILKGNIRAPPAVWGETILEERLRGSCYSDVVFNADKSRTGSKTLDYPQLEDGNIRLYGGAQYRRALEEFRVVVNEMECPCMTREEIANCIGIDDIHDGVNYFRAACSIAVEKARESFEPITERLSIRCGHIMKRIFLIGEYILKKHAQTIDASYGRNFYKFMESIYNRFVEECLQDVQKRCQDDLKSLTRFVSWNLSQPTEHGLKQLATAFYEQGKLESNGISTLWSLGRVQNNSSNKKHGRDQISPLVSFEQLFPFYKKHYGTEK
eukprot:jgi/Galph1/1511/GphlegSOOS_G197.1